MLEVQAGGVAAAAAFCWRGVVLHVHVLLVATDPAWSIRKKDIGFVEEEEKNDKEPGRALEETTRTWIEW